jgi:hypothetical protein
MFYGLAESLAYPSRKEGGNFRFQMISTCLPSRRGMGVGGRHPVAKMRGMWGGGGFRVSANEYNCAHGAHASGSGQTGPGAGTRPSSWSKQTVGFVTNRLEVRGVTKRCRLSWLTNSALRVRY